jgi:hypothetical protein
MIPATHLFTAPTSEDAYGVGMPSADLIRGLSLANPLICVPTPHGYVHGGSAATGTGIWLGPPRTPGSKFICGLDCGTIPEWTLYEDGKIITRGWRAILQRCIDTNVASRRTLEHIFKCDLLVGKRSRFCSRCSRQHKWVPAYAASGLCDDHDAALKMARLRAQP